MFPDPTKKLCQICFAIFLLFSLSYSQTTNTTQSEVKSVSKNQNADFKTAAIMIISIIGGYLACSCMIPTVAGFCIRGNKIRNSCLKCVRKVSACLKQTLVRCFRKMRCCKKSPQQSATIVPNLSSTNDSSYIMNTSTLTTQNFLVDRSISQITFLCTQTIKVENAEETAKEPIEEDMLCIICMDRKKNAIYQPCQHICACIVCAYHTLRIQGTCPLCRQIIIKVENTYL